MQNNKIYQTILAAIIAALYVSLTVPAANIAYGMIQFRLAEALTVLPAFTPAAIPAVFLGCFIANILNPQNLGLIDIIGGSLCTALAAGLSYKLAEPWRAARLGKPGAKDFKSKQLRKRELLMLLPPVLVNALIVGAYLPFLFTDSGSPPFSLILITQLSILLSQTIVIYGIGYPFLKAIAKTKFLR
ncbi:MAG: QueT transporter family protein [Eubacteriales bacterium]|nr:QueT transporter family protein [Eubacteriales bacterium]